MRPTRNLSRRVSEDTKVAIIFIVNVIVLVLFLRQVDIDNRKRISEENNQRKQYEDKVNKLNNDIKGLEDTIKGKDNQINQLKSDFEEYKKSSVKVPTLSRGGSITSKRTMKVTVYNLSFKDCGKRPTDPGYGVTASGEVAQALHTVASGGNDLPFGTKLYIPYFKDYDNHGIFVVEDRGGGVGYGHLDILTPWSEKKMNEFGVKYLDVYIISEPGR